MKILYLIHQFLPEHYRGTEKFVFNVATNIKERGHDVKVVTMSFYPDSFYSDQHNNILLKEFTYKGIPIIAIKHHVDDWKKFSDNPTMMELAKKILLKEKPDLVHVGHTIRVAEFVAAIQDLNIPYLVTMTDFYLMCHHAILLTTEGKLCYGPKEGENCVALCPQLTKEELINRYQIGRKILLGAKGVIAPSKFLAEIFTQEFQNLDIQVINYGVNTNNLKINKKHYKKNSNLTFCYAGSIDYHKGVHILLKAFSTINSDKAVLKIYGSGNEEIKRLARDNPRIQFCGVYADYQIGKIFSKADLLIVPSMWHENRPQVITEALACGLPVLASAAGGIEQITPGANGFTFKLGSTRDLTKALRRIIRNPEILNKVKAGIAKTKLATAQEEAKKYEGVYKELLD